MAHRKNVIRKCGLSFALAAGIAAGCTSDPPPPPIPHEQNLHPCQTEETYVIAGQATPDDATLKIPCEIAAKVQRQLVEEHTARVVAKSNLSLDWQETCIASPIAGQTTPGAPEIYAGYAVPGRTPQVVMDTLAQPLNAAYATRIKLVTVTAGSTYYSASIDGAGPIPVAAFAPDGKCPPSL